MALDIRHLFASFNLPTNGSRSLLTIAFFAIIVIVGCNDKPRTETLGKRGPRFANLLNKFQDVTFDTLEIYSSDGGDNQRKKYNGIVLDSSEAILFPPEIARRHFSNPPGLFACYKFQLDSSTTALLARTPSEYDATSIKLFIYDIQKDSITTYKEVAESWGDAGDSMTKRSWIVKDKKSEWGIFYYREDCSYEEDDVQSCWDSLAMFKISGKRFISTQASSAALSSFKKAFVKETISSHVKKSTIISSKFPLADLFGIWTVDPNSPQADFRLDSISFYIVNYDGDGSMAYRLDYDTLTIDYADNVSKNIIKKANRDSLSLLKEDGIISHYVRWRD